MDQGFLSWLRRLRRSALLKDAILQSASDSSNRSSSGPLNQDTLPTYHIAVSIPPIGRF